MQALSQLSYTPKPEKQPNHVKLAEWTGLEPATPGVTGRYSNQLNYHSTSINSPACAVEFGLSLLSQTYVLASPRGFEPRLSP